MSHDLEESLCSAEEYLREPGRISISALQRKFKIDYWNACSLMEQLTLRGVVSPIDAEGHRHILPKVTS